MTDEIIDLLGEDEPAPKPKRGRPPKPKVAPKPKYGTMSPDPDLAEIADGALPDPAEFFRPVRITFLARILNTEPRRIERRLARCNPIGYENHKGHPVPVYNFKEAVSYCIPPRMDMATWIRAQNPASLPVHINKAFWEAERARLAVEREAGQLWHTADVLDVLGGTAMAIKEAAQLWIENLPGKASMTTEQFNALQGSVTSLMDDIHQRLVALPQTKLTKPAMASIEASLADIEIITEDGDD